MFNRWGWAEATYKRKSGTNYEFQYVTGDEVTVWPHKLNIADYGATALWVVTARDD